MTNPTNMSTVPSAVIDSNLKYVKTLDDLWDRAFEKRTDDAPTFISTFAGCGGSSLGYLSAGFRELFAVEFEPNAADTLKRNFPNLPLWDGDIRDFPIKQWMKTNDIVPGGLDHLDGSPPCQGFSLAGPRLEIDERNFLYLEYMRFIDALQPKTILLENVIGMVAPRTKLVFNKILGDLVDRGYKTKTVVIDMSYFGVPSKRRRVIIFGIRDDIDIDPTFPKAQRYPINAMTAIVNVDDGFIPELKDKYSVFWSKIPVGGSPAKLNSRGHSFGNCVKVDPRKPFPTICAMNTGRGYATITHWSEKRSFSIDEIKRGQSFPDQFDFGEPITTDRQYRDTWEQIGNAVPPMFMYHMAKHVADLVYSKVGER